MGRRHAIAGSMLEPRARRMKLGVFDPIFGDLFLEATLEHVVGYGLCEPVSLT